MASSAAQAYFQSFSPEDQEAIRASWGGADLMDAWFDAAQKAGAVPSSTPGGGEGGGGWKPKNKAELVQYAAQQGWSEDFARFDDATVQHWIDNYWDPSAGAFKSDKTTPEGGEVPGRFEKPSETPPGWEAWGEYARPTDGGGGGGGFGGGGGGYGGGPGGAGGKYGYAGAPLLDLSDFKAPSYEEAMADPGYQFALKEGQGALERSASAKGTLRSGGTLKDLIDYGQGMAAQQYGNVFDRAVTKYGLDTGAAQAEFAPLYGSWQTQYGGDLSKWTTKYGGDLQKYLQKEQNIYGLLSAPPITYGG